jgi:subtilisin family serine protease
MIDKEILIGPVYPGQITIDGITFTKSRDDLYLELHPGIKDVEVEQFFNRHETLIQHQFEPEDEKMLLLKTFNRSSHHKWVLRTAGTKEPVDKLISQLESDTLIYLAAPVYMRKELKHPNGFTFKDEIIIRFSEKTTAGDLQALFQGLGVEEVKGRLGELGKGMKRLRVLEKDPRKTVDIARKLDQSELILSARVNLIQLHGIIDAVPNDTYFSNQWNLRNTGQMMPDGGFGTPGSDINVEPAWDISTGSPLIVIAVLDTGCDLAHVDLLPQYVQPDRWYNAETGTASPDDDLGHGSLCAGIVSASTHWLTARGTAGIGWHCRIMPIRIWWDSGQTTTEATVLNALDFALNNGAHVINMSWEWEGGQGNIDIKLQECVDAGLVLCAASGNRAGTYPDVVAYPASNSNVIAVGATNEDDWRCTGSDWPWGPGVGSQYGPELSVVAPGVHTWSTDMMGLGQGYNSAYGGGDASGDYYEDFGGTSGATAHVSGLAALMLAYNPTLTPAQVRTIIETNADDLVGNPAEDTAGWDKYMGYGRIDAHASLLDVQTNYPYGPASVYIRNSLTDGGVEPYIGGLLCYSPDIITRKVAVADPQTAFADMTVDPGSDPVEIGNDNYIYVRVHNDGVIGTDIHVRLYYAPLNTSCAPDVWEYLGQVDFSGIAAGADAVSDALVWENVPDPGATGHFCIIASIEGAGDPHPDPAGIANASQYMQFIRDHNNICYRNVTFEDEEPDGTFELNFYVGGFIGDESNYQLRIEREELAVRADVGLKLPLELFKYSRAYLDNMNDSGVKEADGFRLFKLEEGKSAAVNRLVIPGPRYLAQLEVKIPPDAKPGEVYRFTVQQVFENEVIGDFTVMGKIIDPQKAAYIGLQDTYLAHKAGCQCAVESVKESRLAFGSLEAAKSAGYDLALDCLNQPFKAADVSHRLARKILHFVNNVRLARDLAQTVQDTLGIGYSEGRYGKQVAGKKGYGLGIGTAGKIIETRDKIGGFTKLQQLEAIKGVGKDTFIDLVNSFK